MSYSNLNVDASSLQGDYTISKVNYITEPRKVDNIYQSIWRSIQERLGISLILPF